MKIDRKIRLYIWICVIKIGGYALLKNKKK